MKEKDPDTFLGHALQNHERARISLNDKCNEFENLLNTKEDLSDVDLTDYNHDHDFDQELDHEFDHATKITIRRLK